MEVIPRPHHFYPQTQLFRQGAISRNFQFWQMFNIFPLHQPEIEVYQIFFENLIVHLKLMGGHQLILDHISDRSGRNLTLKSKKKHSHRGIESLLTRKIS